MKRLTETDLNTSDYFDNIWNLEGIHKYDALRVREFLVGVQHGYTILDVGAGLNGFAQYAMEHHYPGTFFAIDFSEEARRRTFAYLAHFGFKQESTATVTLRHVYPPATLTYWICSALDIPFPDNNFNVVGCGELIEHMEKPEDLVAELMRVCKPGGVVRISTLDANCEAAKAHGEYPEHLWQWESAMELLPYFTPYGNSKAWVLGHYFMVECRKGQR